jgi:transcriptional regulator with XRE-family HTH domain
MRSLINSELNKEFAMQAIKTKLQASLVKRGNLNLLCLRSGISHTTIRKIACGEIQNPGILTVQAIEEALVQLEAEAKDTKTTAV